MKYSKMDKKSSEVSVSPLQMIEENHEIISEEHRLNAEKPETLWIFVKDLEDNDVTHDNDAETISLDDTETSSVLLEDVEIQNSQLKELRFQTESFLNETEKLIASSNSMYSVCKEYHAKLSCLTSEQPTILTEETSSEPFKNTCSDMESLNMGLETLKSMLKEKDQLITELRSQIERLFQINQYMEKLEVNLCEKKQTTIENSNSDLDKNSLDTKLLNYLIKNEEIQNPMTDELTMSKIEAAELKEEMKQLEKLKKSHWEPMDELKIKEEDKLVSNKSFLLIF